MGLSWTKKKQLIDECLEKLKNHNSVISASQNHYFIKVTFKTGITEYWAKHTRAHGARKKHVFLLPDSNHFTGHEVPIYNQFEINPFIEETNRLKDHFIVKKKDFAKLGWCERRCLLHDLSLKLGEEGWKDLWYTDELLREEFEDVKSEDLSVYQTSLIRYEAFSGKPLGKRLLLHFLNHKYNWTAYDIFRVLKDHHKGDITREDIVYKMMLTNNIVRYPGFCRSLLEILGISGKKILDLAPDIGFKALGVMADGGIYHSDISEELAPLAKFVGGECWPNNEDYYDIILVNDVMPGPIDELQINKLKEKADFLVVVVSAADRKEAIDKFSPQRVLRLKTGIARTANFDDYVLIIGQR